jgi:protein-export membrane protein SecD
MRRSNAWQLAVVILLALVALYVDLNVAHPDWVQTLLFWRPADQRDIGLRLGLDLQGGLQVLLAADVPADQPIESGSMETARRIVENRVNALGLTEPVVQAQGERRIIVELPGIENPEQAVDTIKGTALLEFVDASYTPLPDGTIVTTTLGGPQGTLTATTELTSTSPLSPTAEIGLSTEITPTTELSPTAESPITPTQPTLPSQSAPGIYETILTGAGLTNVDVNRTQQGEFIVSFELKPEAATIFGEYTTSHVGQYLCIVLDKTVISCPVIKSAITGGSGMIEGNFTLESARQLALQLRYGALPVPLRVESFNRIGATLGHESVNRSVRAGVIGLAIVLLFMLIYYRLPGSLADLSLITYVLLNFALYKLAPVTLTLPGIAGFLLSAGMAVDANILIFERMKEELRHGRGLTMAIEAGFERAWTSIRDSQLSTIIICIVLYIFGSNFGASIVKGFAITLAIGTAINLFTAFSATRIFLRQVAASAGEWLAGRKWLLGV